MKNIKFGIHWSFFLLGILMLAFGRFQAFLSCILCVVLHEMGHAFIGRKLGYKLNMITLMPYGAMLSGKDIHIEHADEIKIAIAGPSVNAILIIISFIIIHIFPNLYNFLYCFVYANIYTLIFNLLPVYPMDGGRICLSILSKNKKRTRAYAITQKIGYIVCGIILLLFFISAFFELNYMLGINALFMLIGLLEDDKEIYYQKVKSLEKFSYTNKNKCISLSNESTLFDAYKKMVECKAKKICFLKYDKKIEINQNRFSEYILKLPINTKLCDLN